MFDAKRLLDALVGGSGSAGRGPGQPGPGGLADIIGSVLNQLGQGAQAANQATGGTAGQVLGQATSGLSDLARAANQATGGAGTQLDQSVGQLTGGQTAGDLAQKARDFAAQNPGAAGAAALGAAGLILGTRQGRSLAGQAAGLGGLALIAGLAYKAWQNHAAGRPLLGEAPGAGGPGTGQPVAGASALPSPAAFDPQGVSEDEAMLYLRAMVAAASADGQIDADERARIMEGIARTGIDQAGARWLEAEIANPASVEAIAGPVSSPEQGAKVYAAARIAIEPDTMQEREFLRRLAEALDLDFGLRAEIDAAATGIKVRG